MLSVPAHDWTFGMRRPGLHRQLLRRRLVLGVALSLGAHVAMVALLVVPAVRRGPVAGGGGNVVVARAGVGDLGGEGVPVDLVDDPLAGAGSDARAATVLDAEAGGARNESRRGINPGASGQRGRGGRTSSGPRMASAGPGTTPGGGADAGIVSTDAAPPPPPPANPDDEARAAFRARLRRHLHDAWRANEVFGRIDPQGRLDGSLFTTALRVRLRGDGRIERSELAESSGMPALDKEAEGALARMAPLPPLPPAMLDAQGGWTVLCKFYLDVGMFRFAADIRRVLAGRWTPSRAFAATASDEKRTVVRFLVGRDGVVQGGSVLSSAGIDFLDRSALAVAEPGLRLPPPPRAFLKADGPAQVFVAFLHLAGDVRVLKPREDVEDE